MFQRLSAVSAALFCILLLVPLPAEAGSPLRWDQAVEQARGQTVYWNAWAGDERVNAYIAWVAERVAAEHGVELRHVKVTDTAEAVSRVLAEKAAGRTEGGSVDLVWINGENFAAMKENGLLYGPFVEELPNFVLVDTREKSTTLVDFTVPTEGLEAPWGMARFNFIYDSARVGQTPASIPALAEWAAAHAGRFSYPAPPDFLGSTFLKQALIELTEDADLLQRPVEDEVQFERVTGPLWRYLDRLHPLLWRGGRSFPASGPAQLQLLDDGELAVALSFYLSEAQSLIEDGRLPESARTFVLEAGTIGNSHFVAIPFNARAKAGAMVVANFLMSPEAQAHKQDPAVWGDDTVLALDRLEAAQRALFDAIEPGPATLPPDALGPALLEPHPTWMTRIEAEWARRYGS